MIEQPIIQPAMGLVFWSLALGIPALLGLLGLYWVLNKKDQD